MNNVYKNVPWNTSSFSQIRFKTLLTPEGNDATLRGSGEQRKNQLLGVVIYYLKVTPQHWSPPRAHKSTAVRCFHPDKLLAHFDVMEAVKRKPASSFFFFCLCCRSLTGAPPTPPVCGSGSPWLHTWLWQTAPSSEPPGSRPTNLLLQLKAALWFVSFLLVLTSLQDPNWFVT